MYGLDDEYEAPPTPKRSPRCGAAADELAELLQQEAGETRMNEHLCGECYKFHHETSSAACELCKELRFSEGIICEIVRDQQSREQEFECAAYKPNLTVVNGEVKHGNELMSANLDNLSHDIGESLKVRWLDESLRRVILPERELDSDQVVHDLRFHFCLVARVRAKLFPFPQRTHLDIARLVRECGSRIGIELHCLAVGEDHIHLFVRGDPNLSLDNMAQKIILDLDTYLRNILEIHTEGELFLKSYFAESIGDFLAQF